MKKLLFTLFLTSLINTIAAAESARGQDFAPEALFLHDVEKSMGPDAAAAALSSLTGVSEKYAQNSIKGKNALRVAKGTPAYESFIAQHGSDLASNQLSLGCLKLYLSTFSNYLETHKTEPDKSWFEENLPEFVKKSKVSQRRMIAFKIIEGHACEITTKYLADCQSAMERGEPRERFQGPIQKVITYLEQNNDKAPTRDWLDKKLWPSN